MARQPTRHHAVDRIFEQIRERDPGDAAELVVPGERLQQRDVVAIARAADERDGELERLAVLGLVQQRAAELGDRLARHAVERVERLVEGKHDPVGARGLVQRDPRLVVAGRGVLDQHRQLRAARGLGRGVHVSRQHAVERACAPANRSAVLRSLVRQSRWRSLRPPGDHLEDRRPASRTVVSPVPSLAAR